MTEEKKNYELIPENYEEDMLKRRRASKVKDRDGGSEDININSLMDILTIMLVFLLKSYATDPINITPTSDLELVKSTSLLQPAATVAVTVSKSAIVVDNRPVLVVKDGKVEASQKRGGEDGFFIVPLNKELVDAAEKKRRLASVNPSVTFDGVCTIIMDGDTPYRLLTEVMYTAGQAEFNNFKFATISQES
jgi:biopolymer transport protein ExbD